MDLKIAKQNLLDLKRFLDGEGIEFFLLYGTLLGAMRGGDLIPWDKDIDIGIRKKSFPDLWGAHTRFKKTGFAVWRDWEGLRSVGRDGEYIDILVWKNGGDGMYHNVIRTKEGMKAHHKVRSNELDTLGEVEMWGRTWKTPANPEKFLERVYGADWKTPMRGKHARAFQ